MIGFAICHLPSAIFSANRSLASPCQANAPRAAPIGRTSRSKALLLPVDRASARELSFTHHLALAACHSNGGNKHLINELVRTVDMTYLLQLAGFGDPPLKT